jgi:hypothetical protein
MTRTILAGLAGLAAALALSGGCAKDKDMAPSEPGESAPAAAGERTLVTSAAEMRAAKGKHVEMSGQVERAKLGDVVSGDGFSIVCTGRRLDDASMGTTVTVHGVLEVSDAFAATIGPNGEVSQGTEPGSFTWFIHDCEVVSR